MSSEPNIFDNPNLFVGRPDPNSNKIIIFTQRRPISLRKRVGTIRTCSFCERPTKDLILETYCTNECALSGLFHTKQINEFNRFYIRLSSKLQDPKLIPRIMSTKLDLATTKEFWAHQLRYLYPVEDIRLQNLIQRLNESKINSDTPDEDQNLKKNKK